MRIIENSDKEVFSARCPKCLSLLYFTRADVHQPGTEVQNGDVVSGCATHPFVVCPKCLQPIAEIYDLDGIRKVSG